ncbi:AAA family ATPase [Streptomyces rimosus]|uniref:AAA family ATPase n=1 Tax=Streptomyces rimosus TaxID=1927 RepID=UPI0004C8BD75|nr:AAA family ATPase [Streptomyces rimosus]
MGISASADATGTGKSVMADRGPVFRPRGVVDLRGVEDVPAVLTYPAQALVVVSGLPGSGKSTLLRRLSQAAPVIDPRVVHVACEAVMPDWLPYAVYRPWARWTYFRWLRGEVRSGGPLFVHDCGGRPWMRRWLARSAVRQGRELHLVMLDVGVAEALSGQEARGRWAPRRAFARHRRGLERLLRAWSAPDAAPQATDTADPASPPTARIAETPDPVSEAASVVLLDRRSRERVVGVEFGGVPMLGRVAR